jgi:hypothetical protein
MLVGDDNTEHRITGPKDVISNVSATEAKTARYHSFSVINPQSQQFYH